MFNNSAIVAPGMVLSIGVMALVAGIFATCAIAAHFVRRLNDEKEGMRLMADQPESTTYKYYTLGPANPIRVTLNSRGHEMGAERYDPETGGLKIDNRLLSRIELNWEAEEIDEARFEELRKHLSRG